MKTNKDIGFFKKLILKGITKLQEITISYQKIDFYWWLTELHFSMYFGKNLQEESLINSEEFKAAAKRHAEMVSAVIFKTRLSKPTRMKRVFMRAFRNNSILRSKI